MFQCRCRRLTSLARDIIEELADKTVLMSKCCMSSRVRGEEDDTREVEVESEKKGGIRSG